MSRFCKLGLKTITGVEDSFALGIEEAVNTNKIIFSVLNLNGPDDKEIGGCLTFDYGINLLTVIILVNIGSLVEDSPFSQAESIYLGR